jgi:predicted nucleic-acid-binding protein
MIGVDANVLLRLLTADDSLQHQVALDFFSRRSAESPAFVSTVTLAEIIWVLRRTYRLTPEEIRFALNQILDSDDFVVEAREGLEFIQQDDANPAHVGDYLIAHLGKKAGCDHTVTFDKRAAKRVPNMELIG